MKITFKKRPRATGLLAVGRPHGEGSEVKVDGWVVGWISPPHAIKHRLEDEKWQAWFHFAQAPTENDPTPFLNRRVKAMFTSEEEARDFVLLHLPGIAKKNPLHKRVRLSTKPKTVKE